MTINGITMMSMEIDIAKQEHKKYVELSKKSSDDNVLFMKRALWELSKGRELIDIYQAFRNVPTEDDMPKIAIVRADAKTCYFEKRKNGAGCFGHKTFRTFGSNKYRKGKIALPAGTFRWENDYVSREPATWGSGFRYGHHASTVVPTIPAYVYPPHALLNYFILWEVERGGWEPEPLPPGDPYLLKRISPNLFVPLASWDLTPLEQSIMSGVGVTEW